MPLKRFSCNPIESKLSKTSSDVVKKSCPSDLSLQQSIFQDKLKFAHITKHAWYDPMNLRVINSNDSSYAKEYRPQTYNSILASNWRASNCEPSGATPAIAVHRKPYVSISIQWERGRVEN